MFNDEKYKRNQNEMTFDKSITIVSNHLNDCNVNYI